MKIRRSSKSQNPSELQMSAMIDIVFLLLVFFVMTFRIVLPEGDFNIKMPLSAPRDLPIDQKQVPLTKVRITADRAGMLQSIRVNDLDIGTRFDALQSYLISFVGPERMPGSIADTAEVELDCDYHLRYEYVIEAISAVSGYISDDKDGKRQIIKLIEKIKFASPKKEPGGQDHPRG